MPNQQFKKFGGGFHANYLHEIKHLACKGLRNVSPRKEERSRCSNLTWLYFQGATVNLDVEPFGRRTAEVFKHTVDGFCDIIGHRLVQLHPAVHHNAAVPEVENLQLLESSQVGLQVRQKLRSTGGGREGNSN